MDSIFEIEDRRTEILRQLIKLGSGTPRQLYFETGIPKNKVYGYLKDLRELNLVAVFPGASKKVEAMYAIKKEEILNHLSLWKKALKNKISDCETLEKRVESEIPAPPFMPDIQTGRAGDAESKTIEILRRAKRSICISTYTFSWFERISEILSEKLNAGLNAKVLMLDPSSKEFFSFGHKRFVQKTSTTLAKMGAEVYYCKSRLPFRGTIVDKSVLLMMAFPYLGEKDRDMSTGFLLCNKQVLVHSIANYFESACQHGLKYSSA